MKKTSSKGIEPTGLFFDGERVADDSPLYAAFGKLSKLPETALPLVGSLIDLLYSPEGLLGVMAGMQARLDLLEQGASSPTEPSAEPAPAEPSRPSRKKRSRKSSATKTGVVGPSSVELELEIPIETAAERQARMARMEKEEKKKVENIGRHKDKAPAKPQLPVQDAAPVLNEQGEPAPKKKPRRRRKRSKGPSVPPDAVLPA